MLRKVLIIINPVTVFLAINLVISSKTNLFEDYSQMARIDYVNIGSSHGIVSIDYGEREHSINLGFGSQRMHYGLMLIDSIRDKLDENSTIIIPISIFSFCGRFDGPNHRYLGFLSREELGLTIEAEIIERYFPYIGIHKAESLFFRQRINEDLFIDNGDDRAKNHIQRAYDCGIIDSDIVNRMKVMIDENRDSNIVFVITPYYESYWRTILNEQVVVDIVYDTIYEFVNEYDLIFLDYSDDYRFNDQNLYRDSDHLNRSGAIYFTNVLIEDIKKTQSNS
jgi:hypothetical protein